MEVCGKAYIFVSFPLNPQLNCVGVPLTRPDPDYRVHREDEDLAIANGPGSRSGYDLLDNLIDYRRLYDHLDLDLG